MDNSLWIATYKQKEIEKLKNKIEADVCIIGGGLTRDNNRILSFKK